MGTRNTLMPLWKVVTAGQLVYTLSGTVADSASAGVSGVTITLSGDSDATTTTAGDGTWSFSGLTALPAGSYTVTPTKTAYIFNPSSSAETITTAAVTDADFNGYTLAASGKTFQFLFDDASGQALTDTSGNSRHLQLGSASGTDTNDPSWIVGGGLDYVTDDYCTHAGGGDVYGAAFTLLCVHQTDADAASPIVNFSNGDIDSSIIENYSVGRAILIIGPGATIHKYFAADAPSFGDYHYYELTLPSWDDTGITASKLYRDRAELSQHTLVTGGAVQARSDLRFGMSGTEYLDGKQQFYMMYSRVLTTAELTENYNYVKTLMATRSITI